MASITIYKLNNTEQLDLFFNQDGKLNLVEIQNAMKQKAAIITEGKINGEGFVYPVFKNLNGIEVLEAYGTDLVNLGNYFDTVFGDDSSISSTEKQYRFFSKAKIIITEDKDLILKFDNSTEEKVKGKVKALIEGLGFETEMLHLNDSLFRKIMEDDTFEWSAININRVDRDEDRTTKVSYEIDLANDKHTSHVDETYREHGDISHIKFQLPYEASGAAEKITVNLYNNAHRAYFEESELGDSSVDDFVVFLMKKLVSLT